MNADLYHAQYFGGPWDGMGVVATHRYGEDTGSLPVATPNGQPNLSSSTTDNFQAIYKLRRTCHLIERGATIIRDEFEFVGLEVVAPVTRSIISSLLAGWREGSPEPVSTASLAAAAGGTPETTKAVSPPTVLPRSWARFEARQPCGANQESQLRLLLQ